MKHALKTLVVILAAGGLVGCGGGDAGVDECGEGTVEQDGECVPEECDDGEVRDDEQGRCVPEASTYCGEGTSFDDEEGLCVGALFDCGDETVDEDGECRPETEIDCGEGTVADGGVCRPHDDVCGEGTDEATDGCELSDEVCGEGTTFDFSTRLCVPVSELECGPGTRLETDTYRCLPTETYYRDLADDPDVDLTEEETDGAFELPGAGDRVVFTGTIGEPVFDGQDYVQNEDTYRFDADAGQWLEVTVYSLGLPEPGFQFRKADGEVPHLDRWSDVGAGIEVSREVVVAEDGTWELNVSNTPQMLDLAAPAGGDDWGYVGYVEAMERPDAEDFDLLGDTVTGDIRELSDNYYQVEADDADSVAMIFEQLPEDADGELQVWTDETTLESIYDLDTDAFSFEPPSDSFQVVFDRARAYGDSLTYTAGALAGESVAAGATMSRDVELEAGDYAGLLQYNLEGHDIEARILDGEQVLAAADELRVSNAEQQPVSLFTYSDIDRELTLELENTSGEDLDFLAFESVVGTADEVEEVDGSLIETTHEDTLPRGHRHYFELDVDFDGDLSIRIEDAIDDSSVELRDADDQWVADGRNAAIFEAEPGRYVASVEARGALDGGFRFAIEETELYDVDATSAPAEPIPDEDPEGIDDTVTVDACPYIQDIEVELNITHEWRNDLEIELTPPVGDPITLHERDGGGLEDINATYPYPDNSGVSADQQLRDAAELLELVGFNGTGVWTLHVSDHFATMTGTLDNWTVSLSCEG